MYDNNIETGYISVKNQEKYEDAILWLEHHFKAENACDFSQEIIEFEE